MIPRFDWDPAKADANFRKHGVTFIEAAKCFCDPRELTKYDEKNSIIQDRYVTIGLSARGRLLVVAHSDDGVVIRIISARPATRLEALQYADR